MSDRAAVRALGAVRWSRRRCGDLTSPSRWPDGGLGDAVAFYHVHSFVCRAADGDVVGRGEYGERFASIVERDNVAGVQFHPEKSSRDGLALLRNFVTT